MNMRAIGSYRVLRSLGAGGMGEVLLGYDERLERPVALKRVRGSGHERHRRLRREAQMVASLSHANIVQVHDLVDTDDGVVVVMEFVEGRTIDDLLRDGPLDVAQAIDLGRQIARGLDAAHAAGLIHRDLKPANVMVSADGIAKVLDFGIAKSLAGDSMTATGAVIGTYRSMSPEQALGKTVDARSDLFALGALLYEMLTGVSPFAADTPLATLQQVTEAMPTPVGSLRPRAPAALIALIDALLAKDPAARTPSAGHVARILDGLLANTPPPGQPVPAPVGNFATTVDTPSAAVAADRASRDQASRDWASHDRSAPPSTGGPGPHTRPARRKRAMTATAVVVVALTVLGSLWQARARPTLRVLLLPPTVEGAEDAGGEDASDAGFVQAGYTAAGIRALTHLDGIRVIDPAEARDLEGTPSALARAVAADETVQASLRIEAATAFVTLSRATADGTIHWANTFQVPTAPEDALVLAAAVTTEITRAFDDHAPPDTPPTLGASSTDYAAFLKIKESLDSGDRGASETALDKLQKILLSSSDFLDAHLLATSLAITTFRDSGDLEVLALASEHLRAAYAIAPSHPQVLETLVRIELERGDITGAIDATADLSARIPGDASIPIARSWIAEKQGKLEEAITWMAEATQRMPSWRGLWRLADLAYRSGSVEVARKALDELQVRSPDNSWGLSLRGQLELIFGDIELAAEIYQHLLSKHPHRRYYTNFGLSQYLLRNYSEAIAAYQSALQRDPNHVATLLNLADAELASGESEGAFEHYRQIVRLLESKQSRSTLEPTELTNRAQALAHLGESFLAVEATLDALQQFPEDAQVVFEAAIVYSIVGDRASALATLRRALALGTSRRWLDIPMLDNLRQDADFAQMASELPERSTQAASPRDTYSSN